MKTTKRIKTKVEERQIERIQIVSKTQKSKNKNRRKKERKKANSWKETRQVQETLNAKKVKTNTKGRKKDKM